MARRRVTRTVMTRNDRHRENEDEQTTMVLYELCSMIIHIFRSPPRPLLPVPFLNFLSISIPSSSTTTRRITHYLSSSSSPSAFAALFFGMSLAMMFVGSITFLIGLVLLPWVIGLVVLFYLAEFAFNLSELGRSFLCSPTTSSSFKDFPEWEL